MRFGAWVVGFLSAGCVTSLEAQRDSQEHQYKSDQAAASGFYGKAADEQRKTADAHHTAVKKAIDEGLPIPEQPRAGDPWPDGGVTCP